MKRRVLPLLSAAAVCLIAGLAWSLVKVDLTYQDFKDASDQLAGIGKQWTNRLGTTPPVKGAPGDLSDKAAYFRVQMAGKRVLFVVDPADPPKLYLDSDVDLDFSDEKAVTGEKTGEEQCRFGPLTIKDPKDKDGRELRLAVMVYIQNGYPTYAMLTAPGSYAGTAKLGDKEYTIALVDGDLDGRYGGAGARPGAQGQDILAIDQNQDGRFQGEAFEIMPAGAMARVGGAYYDLVVEADGSAVTFTPSSLPLGTLKVASPTVELALTSPKGYLPLEAGVGSWSVPAGTYTVASLRLTTTDKDGNRWTLDATRLPGDLARVTIEAGKETVISFGPPLTLKLDVTTNQRNVSVTPTLAGQAGEPYLAAATKNGEQLGAPKVRIVDEKGKELHTGTFAYG